jgi:hypothetical protein
MLVVIFGLSDSRSFFNLKNAFRDFLYNSKVFNRVLSLRLDKFLQDHNIIHESQIGFTKKARTADHMFVINCLINKYCSSKDGRLFACFVDLKKAFDTVIHILL